MDELLDGGAHTLYVTAPIHDQARFRPLFAAVIRQVLTAVFERASDTPLAAPLLLVLDEAANIAPVEDLPTVASTAASMGLQLVTVFQDVAQIKDRYGDHRRHGRQQPPGQAVPARDQRPRHPRSDQPARRRARDRPRLDHQATSPAADRTPRPRTGGGSCPPSWSANSTTAKASCSTATSRPSGSGSAPGTATGRCAAGRTTPRTPSQTPGPTPARPPARHVDRHPPPPPAPRPARARADPTPAPQRFAPRRRPRNGCVAPRHLEVTDDRQHGHAAHHRALGGPRRVLVDHLLGPRPRPLRRHQVHPWRRRRGTHRRRRRLR